MGDARKLEKGSTLCWTDTGLWADRPLDLNGPIDRPFEAFPEEAKSRPIIQLLQQVVARYPARIALVEAGRSMTYAELWRAVGGLAEQIAHTTAPGDLVGISSPISMAFPIAALSCLAAGRPFVALDPTNPPEWLARVLDDSRPSLLLTAITEPSVVGPIRGAIPVLNLSDVKETSADWQPALLGPDEPACVLFTSGSTGQPKGIVNSQRNLLQRASQSINAAHINSDDRFLTLTSLCTIVGVRDLITALLAGASFCLLDSHKAGAREILRFVRDERVSILFSFPALLRSVVQGYQVGAGDHLRLVRIGGDTTLWSDVALLRDWMSPGTFIQSIYAATEAPMMQWFIDDSARMNTASDERIPIGYPLPGNALAVVDESGARVRDGEVGELLVRGAYVTLGIWSRGRCEATNIRIDAGQSMRTFATGDLVRRRADGFFDRIGRKDRQVKVRGARVELDGVEVAIRRHAFVRDVAVIGRVDGESRNVQLVAYVQLRDSASESGLRDVAAMMRRIVPSHMQPWRYYAIASIPRLSNSKLDSNALHAMDRIRNDEETDSNVAAHEHDWMAKDSIEALVARVWRDVLGLRLIAAENDFFDLGGDSLRAIAMTVELEKALGRELPINLISQAPTFSGFCEQLRRFLHESGHRMHSPLVVLKAGSRLPSVFFVHGVGGNVMELFGIARKMSWLGPVIGIQARGVDGRHSPHKSVEAMTDDYLAAVKTRQPTGPYLLCGYSFGGLVAFEMARRLKESGNDVAFVGLFATLPPGNHLLRAWTWAALLYRRLMHSVIALKSANLAIRRREKFRSALAAGAQGELRGVALKALSASLAYRPNSYAGEVTVFEPDSRDLGVPFIAGHWRRYAQKVDSRVLRGRHDDMMIGVNAEAAAGLLTHCLEEAVGKYKQT